MGSFTSKAVKEETETPAKVSAVKRIEDPRSPTDEISRTPIEVTDKILREYDVRNFIRSTGLTEQNYDSTDFSPRIRKSEWQAGRDVKQLKYSFLAIENECSTPTSGSNSTVGNSQLTGKENTMHIGQQK